MRILHALILFLFASIAMSADWNWIKTTNVVNGWDVSKGKALIEISGESIVAYLYWEDDPNKIKYTLTGNIKNDIIKVTETVHNSDFSGSVYSGTYNKKTWDGFADSVGAESINLSDGWGMIGITRVIPR